MRAVCGGAGGLACRRVGWGLLGLALTATGCEASHLIGSAGFVRTRFVEPQLAGWANPQLQLGDLDGDGVAELWLLDPRRGELCLRRAEAKAGALRCQALDPSAGPSRLGLAQLTSVGQPQVLVAGQAFLSIAGWPADQPLTIAQRYPLTLPVAQVERSSGWRAGGEAATDVVWTATATLPIATAWLWPGAAAATAATAPVPIDFALSAAATALLPVSPGQDGGRELFVATLAGVEHYSSRGTHSLLPCAERLAGSPRLALLDLDGDDDDDLVALAKDGTLQAVERRTSPPGWGCLDEAPLAQPGRSLLWLAAADFDGDGKRDLLAATAERSEGLLLWRRGLPTLRYPLSAPARAVSLADGDGDGHPDVAVVLSDGSLEFFHNSFAPR